MAPFGISITKSTSWRGSNEEFSNVYHYDTSTVINTDSGWEALVNDIVSREKDIHGQNVNFLRARVWGPTYEASEETQALKDASIMRWVGDLTGTGNIPSTYPIAKELAICVSFYVGRSARGYKRFLRKYWHVGAISAGSTDPNDRMGNTALPVATRDSAKAVFEALKTVSVGGFSHDLCTPGGDHLPLGSNAIVLAHLRTRQFHQ